jgi:hypothetical protein
MMATRHAYMHAPGRSRLPTVFILHMQFNQLVLTIPDSLKPKVAKSPVATVSDSDGHVWIG